MNDLVVVSGVRYAVLEDVRADGGSGRFVLAYRNEYSLRDLIAPSCIAASGISSREEAAARSKPSVSMATIQKHVVGATVATAVKGTEEVKTGFRRARHVWGMRLASQTIRRFLVAFYNDVVATAILSFSSRNIISVVLRTLLAV